MAAREPDAAIAPMKPGNAGRGKGGTQAGPAKGAHFLYTGIGGKKNGNKTWQDRRNASKEPKDGVHIAMPPDQPGAAARMPPGNGRQEGDRRGQRHQRRVWGKPGRELGRAGGAA